MTIQQRAIETRSRILAAASECFARQGYDATGVAEICQAAGVSKGALYHHFPNKQAIFVELLNQWLAGLDRQFEEVRAQASSVPDVFRQMAEGLEGVFSAADGRLPIFLEFWAQATRDPVIWQATIEPYQRYQGYFAALFAAGVAEGSFRPVDPEAMARALVAMAVGFLLQSVLNPQGADWVAATRAGVEALLEGLHPCDVPPAT